MRKALGVLCGALAGWLVLPSLMLIFMRMRGLDLSESPLLKIGLPIQLGLACVLTLVSIALLRGGKKKP